MSLASSSPGSRHDDHPSESERVREIVDQMRREGFAPALLVFIAADGTSRSVFREGIDLEDLLRFLLASEATREVPH